MIFKSLIKHKRVYENKEESDGKWVLVERLWPRGIKKEKIDIWIKEVAPSEELRRWYSHDESKFDEFKARYLEELKKNKAVSELLDLIKKENVTLVYATKDFEKSGAKVLIEYLEEMLSKG